MSSDAAVPAARRPRPGEQTPAWRVATMVTWILAFLAYMGVWKASQELGIGTWWLGPRSSPRPVVVRLVPVAVITGFVVLAGYHVRRMPWIGLGGAALLAAIAVPDLSRSTGLATVEFAIAGAVGLVSLASATGTYRARPSRRRTDDTGDTASPPATDDASPPATDDASPPER
jgi:hypothetical protein